MSFSMRLAWLLVPLWLPSLVACTAAPFPQTLQFTQRVRIGDTALQVAVLDTPEAHERGLMQVATLPQQSGALFVFEQPQAVAFWMKDTLLALDLFFFDAQGHLLQVVKNAQPCSPTHCPHFIATDVKYVIEVEAGLADTIDYLSKPWFYREYLP